MCSLHEKLGSRELRSLVFPTVLRKYNRRAQEHRGKHPYSNAKAVFLKGTNSYCHVVLNINSKTEIENCL